ncbi:MAG: glycosyltransferase [Bacteroidetes bacterium]|nr:glycosyltransferase [Bacteroidota bacterium]
MGTRILLLADINSVHTQKWAIGLANNGYKIGIFSFNGPETDWYKDYGIECLHKPSIVKSSSRFLVKLAYIAFLPKVKAVIKEFQPEILHAHYASSYGLLGALSGFHPYIISAWGTDVMKFPHKNFITKQIIKFNLKRADSICATSHTIEKHIHQLINKKVEVIPFGVDLTEFVSKKMPHKDDSVFTIGCTKALEKIYNIKSLIISFSELKQKYPYKKIKLMIIGDGSERENLEKLVDQLGINEDVSFEGKLSHEDVAMKINELDVLVNLSEYESFGVSVVEAMACQIPVVVSDAEGLKEVVRNQKNGRIVKPNNISQIVEALENLMLSEDLRNTIGVNAFERVQKNYNWFNNLEQMMKVYNSVL